MKKSLSTRRMLENEAVFRQYNEKVLEGFEELDEVAKETGQEHLLTHPDEPLHFYCECSDENCRKRIVLTPSRYHHIHDKRDRFILLHGHETDEIERVITKHNDFSVVEKFLEPPQHVDSLQPTPVDNV